MSKSQRHQHHQKADYGILEFMFKISHTKFLTAPLWNENTINFVIQIQMGLTGFDSKCKDRARMQAGVCMALKNSYAL